MRFPEFSRDLRRGEEASVDTLLGAAYGRSDIAQQIAALRKAGAIAGETVLPYQDEVVGYYALASMRAPKGWLCLAAVAIAPDWQGSGHGRRLMGVLSEWARLSGQSVIADGPPRFFERAGFVAVAEGLALAGPPISGGLPERVYPAALARRT